VGNAMSFSLKKWENQGESAFLQKVFKRALLIFLLGLLLNTFPFLKRINGDLVLIDFTHIRMMGVLQRIALCYAIASLIIHYFKFKGALIFSGLTLLGYWVLLYFLGTQPDPYSLEGNAALKLDQLIIPAVNLYKGYGILFDPEGLISTLPAVVNVIFGYLAGLFIQRKAKVTYAMLKFILVGLI
jgi:predicted acyltransferase